MHNSLKINKNTKMLSFTFLVFILFVVNSLLILVAL